MRILFCGDIALCDGVERLILEGKGVHILKDLPPIVLDADVFVGNIECPLTNSMKPKWSYLSGMKGQREVGRFLGEIGLTIGSLANNHIADYGKKGLEDTISVLEEQGIKWVGAGWTPEEAGRPLVLEKNGYRVGILALAQPEISAAKGKKWGAGVLKKKLAIGAIRKLTKEADITIAYLHYGVEFVEYPTPQQVSLARSLVDAGANLVIGHHPHVPQGYEFYKKGFIAYSLGNFIFDMPVGHHPFPRLGLLVQAEIDSYDLSRVKVIPVDTTGGTPRLLRGQEQVEAEKRIRQLSEVLDNKEDLRRVYYFTCRDNVYTHLRAFIDYGLRKLNVLRIKSLFASQFWPQILELRIDLIKFLLSGEALRIERSKYSRSRNVLSLSWLGFCIITSLIAFCWRVISVLIKKIGFKVQS